MFTRRIRFLIIAIDIIVALLCAIKGYPVIAGLLFVSAALIAWGHFRNGTVLLVGRAMKQDKLEKAARLLDEIRYPERLSRYQQSQYYFYRGALDLRADRLEPAKAAFDKALEIGMRNETDRAAAYINLGVIAVKEGDKKQARTFLKKIKELKYRPHLRSSIAILERHVK